jgi:hypothetical protein
MKALNPDNSSEDSIINASDSTESSSTKSPSLSSSESDNLHRTPRDTNFMQQKERFYNPSPNIIDRIKQLTNISLNSSLRKQAEHENEMVIFDNETDEQSDTVKHEDENNNVGSDRHDLNVSRVSKRSANSHSHAADKHLTEPNSSACLTSVVDDEREDAADAQVHQRHHSASEDAKLKRNASGVVYMEKVNVTDENASSSDKIKYRSLKRTYKQKMDAGKSYFIVFILFIVNCFLYSFDIPSLLGFETSRSRKRKIHCTTIL